jgi:hypothetical protein
MSKKQAIILLVCMASGAIVLILLFQFSPLNNEVPRSSFNRRFAQTKTLAEMRRVDLDVNSYYFAGATDSRLYLGNWTNPFHVMEVELISGDTIQKSLTVEGGQVPSDYKVFRLKVDSPYFYLTHGRLPGILKGSLHSRIAKAAFSNAPYFVDAIPTNPREFALRCYSNITKAYELAALRIDTPHFVMQPDLLEKQIDGIFCEEGTLHYDKSSKHLVYLYSYRNEFFVADTALALLDRFHTIDTFRRAHIKIAHVAAENSTTLASPPVRTNGISSVFQGKMYVQSVFLAKNEDMLKFTTSAVMDVYDLSTGSYIHSFYVPQLQGRNFEALMVTKDYLAAIYENQLILYQLPRGQ